MPVDLSQYKLGAIKPLPDKRNLPFASLVPAKLPKFSPIYNGAILNPLMGFFPPRNTWGNELYGNCVVASSANYTIHAEYAEQQRILKEITRQQVIDQYLLETNGQDVGLVPSDHFSTWQKTGLNLGGKIYKIDGYAFLEVKDFEQLKAACNWVYGVQICAALPKSAQTQKTKRGYEWKLADGTDSAPASWGYHEMYCPGYIDTPSGQWLLFWTWGRLIKASWEWCLRYVMQAVAILDQKDVGIDSKVDFKALQSYLNRLKIGG
jgi:hypothetical protein